MSSRGRKFNPRPGFQRPNSAGASTEGVHSAILKQARQSGQLNLSNRGLTEVPDKVWRINLDLPEETRNVTLGNSDERWWEQTELTKLILASNAITELSENVQLLPALSVLDIHDNQVTTLPESLGTLLNLQKLNVSHNKLTCLPACLGQLSTLQSLHIEYNQIEELSPEIGNLHNLEDLDLSHNKLISLPPSCGHLTRVRKLNISNNSIKFIPHEIGLMSGLRSLDANHNEIHTLPDELGDLRQLEQLYLRHNKITHLPLLRNCAGLKELHLGNNALMGMSVEHLECLQTLNFLDVRDNKIAKLPEEITLLQDLERLDLANNDLSILPYVLGTLPKLKSIVLDGNPMKSIRRDIIMRGTNELKKYLCSRLQEPAPSQSAKPQGLRKTQGSSGVVGGGDEGLDQHAIASSKALDYSGKKTAEIPEDLWPVAEKAGVTSVNLAKNLLSTIPPQLQSISSSLTELYLGFNKLSVLDSSIGELSKLYILDLRNNQLNSLPDSLARLKQLRELVISINRFRQFPSVIYQLASVEVILASDNQIPDVDAKKLEELKKLATLDLQNNDIMQVPPELGLCTQLRSLQLEGNPFRQPRPAILSKGTLTILEYLRGRIVQ